MKAVLSIEMVVLEPVIASSAAQLLALYPHQIASVAIKLTACGDGGAMESVTFNTPAEDARTAVQSLVTLAQISQPGGTAVRLWYQGRSEEFVI